MAKLKRCDNSYYTERDGHRFGEGYRFAVIHDPNAGRKNVFTVLVWGTGKTAKIIGREVRLSRARELIDAYPRKLTD